MNLTGGLLNNGTWAYVTVRNTTLLDGTVLSLVNPNNSTILNATVQAGNVAFFADANLSINGTWTVKNAVLGTTISRFNVTIWDGVSKPGNASTSVTLFPNELQFVPDVIAAYGLSGTPFQQAEVEMYGETSNNTVVARALNVDIAMTNLIEPWFIESNGIDNLNTEDSVLRYLVIPGIDSNLPACASQSAVKSTGSSTKFKCFTLLVEGATYGHPAILYGADIRVNFADIPIELLRTASAEPVWHTT